MLNKDDPKEILGDSADKPAAQANVQRVSYFNQNELAQICSIKGSGFAFSDYKHMDNEMMLK